MFDGGAGQDKLIGILLPAVQFGGTIDVAFLGGARNDFIFMQVDMTGFTPESGRLHVAVDGGNGSDQLKNALERRTVPHDLSELHVAPDF